MNSYSISMSLVEQQSALGVMEAAGGPEISTFSPVVVPGPLQTEAYARAVLASSLVLPEHVDQAVAIRMKRGRLVQESSRPRVFVITESALRRPAGGGDVLEEQHALLKTLADLPHVTVQVLPDLRADAGSPLWSCGFMISGPEVRVEVPGGVITAHSEVGIYAAHFQDLFSASWPLWRLRL